MTIQGPLRAVEGFCPMGCGELLHIQVASGKIVCIAPDCPQPYAVTIILADPETEHILISSPDSFRMKHPLRERINDELLDCMATKWLYDFSGFPPGLFRLIPVPGQEHRFEAVEIVT